EARLVGCGEKANKAFGFIIKCVDVVRRRMREGKECIQRNQILGSDRVRVRLADETAGALITGVSVFGNELREAFIEPTRDRIGVKTVHHEVDDLVAEKIVAEFVSGISLNEQTTRRMNSATPLFQVPI